MKPTIAITMGDPTGVGPEVILKAISDKNITRLCNPVILGDEAVFKYLISNFQFPISNLEVINLSNLNPQKLKPGKPDKVCAKAMMAYKKCAGAFNNRKGLQDYQETRKYIQKISRLNHSAVSSWCGEPPCRRRRA